MIGVSRATGWAQGLRWFSAEFLVVVTGVLVALALGAWWQEREERDREADYLQQLLADLERTETSLASISEFHWEAANAAQRVSRAFWSPPESLEPSLLDDMMLPRRSGRQRPIMGTIDALISTGDLRLVRSDQLRADLVAYSEFSEATIENIQRHDETYYRTGQLVLQNALDYLALNWMAERAARGEDPLESDEDAPPFPVDPEALFADRDVYIGYGNLGVAHRNQAANYAAILDRARYLHGLVHLHLRGAIDPGNCLLDAAEGGYAGSCGDPIHPGAEFSIELTETEPAPNWTRSFTGVRVDGGDRREPVRLDVDSVGNGRLELAERTLRIEGALGVRWGDGERTSFRIVVTGNGSGES